MSIAIISDIHGNVDALRVVLEDIDRRGIGITVCLGDTIGYGPNPRECLDLVMQRCVWTLMGNHDFAAMYEPTSFNTSAESAAFWTRRQLDLEPDADARKRRWNFLGNLQVRMKYEAAQWYHASPRRPINEYIFPDDAVTAPGKMAQIFDRIEKHCFVGHTHVPGVFTDEPDFYPPADLGGFYTLNDREKCIINPGSVGQPRDRDPRASYVVLDGDEVEFVRLEYDIQAVIDKIKQIPELSDFLGLRLLDGR
ncbi:MAG: metallophosphoesterase family protein [Phycisphaeraceae bacterium]|nr:metallophosphoesterase family protein [Phycisphaeraceae bacterium]